MLISIKKFKSLTSQFNKIQKFAVDGLVRIDSDYSKIRYDLQEPERTDRTIGLALAQLNFKNLTAAHEFSKVSKPPNKLSINSLEQKGTKKEQNILKGTPAEKAGHVERIDINNSTRLASIHESFKFIPKTAANIYFPYVLNLAPLEVMEGNHTFRIIHALSGGYGHSTPEIFHISRDDDPGYDYLDKGFYIDDVVEAVGKTKETRHLIVADQLDINTVHIFALCQIQPKLVHLLPPGNFIQASNAQMTRLRMEKKLEEKHKAHYAGVHAAFEKDYQDNTTLLLLNKLRAGEIDKTVLNDIAFTKTSVTYNQIKIEAEDLMSVIYSQLNFGREYDIYSIAELYAKHIESQLNNFVVVPEFKINGFNIAPTIVNNVRRINGKRINKDEISQAIYRASCHHSQEEYDLFLKRISKMSLLRHDILANGLAIKIHENMDGSELSKGRPSPGAPSIKFFIDPAERRIKLKTDSPEGCRVKLGELIDKVRVINKKTNGNWCRSSGEVRNYRWARKQLARTLRECTTFPKESINEDGTRRIEHIVGISDADIKKLIDAADALKKAAIQRSKDFLATAVKFTKAQKIKFLEKEAYLVEGALRKYAVILETAKVYDYDTKQYRCIVNDQHFRGVGYDDIAARLYALKNDSVMQKKISTLQGQAQPNAEHAHDNYAPAREEEEEILEDMVLD
jgi:hypothetical protein